MLETIWESRWLPDYNKKKEFPKKSFLTNIIKYVLIINCQRFTYDRRENGGVAQLGEHLPCKQGVKSSNLSVSTELQKVLKFKGEVYSVNFQSFAKRSDCTLKTEY